jgi:predicted dinucleotide-binding enzyme
MLGSREPQSEKLTAWIARTGASTGTFAETAAFGEVLVLATLWSGTQSAIELAGPANFEAKVVVDTTNPLDFSRGMPPSLSIGWSDSAGEQVQRWLPGARVVKAFNTIGNAHMVDPQFPGGPPDNFIAGNDAEAKKVVTSISKDFGLGVIDCGGIDGARLTEPMCILWVRHGALGGSWNHAFKMLKK